MSEIVAVTFYEGGRPVWMGSCSNVKKEIKRYVLQVRQTFPIVKDLPAFGLIFRFDQGVPFKYGEEFPIVD